MSHRLPMPSPMHIFMTSVTCCWPSLCSVRTLLLPNSCHFSPCASHVYREPSIMAETSPDTDSTSRRREERDIQVRLIVLSGVGLVIVTAIVLLVADWLFDDFAASRVKVQGPLAPL